MGALLQDLRHAARLFFRSPAFTAAAVATLALGIGANTAIFSVVRNVLWRPLPYPAADRIAVSGGSLPDVEELRRSTTAYDAVAVWASNLYNVRFGAGSEQHRGALVSREFFPMLGRAALGRALSPDDAREPVAVLSHRFWKSRFGADPSVLGKSLALPDRAFTIVGVMPPEFEFPGPRFEFWVPLEHELARTPGQFENRSLRIFRVAARRAPGVSAERAAAETDALSSRLARAFPDTNTGVRFAFEPLDERVLGATRPVLLALLGAVGVVLLIASSNVANLLLARASARAREVAVRTALGATPSRILRQFLTESLLLSAAGGAAGVLLGAWAVSALPLLAPPDMPRLEEIVLDRTVLAFAFSVSLLTGLVFGIGPALGAARAQAVRNLGGSRAASAQGGRLRRALVVAEVALAMVVLVAAGLLTRSLQSLLDVPKGFVPENLLTLVVNVGDLEGDPSRRASALDAVTRRIAALPGVASVGGGTALPPETAQRGTRFSVAGLPELSPEESSAYFVAAGPGYFVALGTRVLEGRAFSDADRPGSLPVVILNRSLARRLFPSGGALGRRVKLFHSDAGDAEREVVGVVEDVRYSGLDDPGEAALYTPFAQTPFLWSYVFVRTRVAPESLAPAVRDAVAGVDPRLVAGRVEPMERIVGESVAGIRFQASLLAGFAALALALAVIGVYGVIAYTTALRRREIGIRVALGASPAQIAALVAGGGMRLIGLGLAAGGAAALATSRLLSGLLFGVGAADPLTYAAVAALMAAVGALAAAGPARRAARVDPVAALRAE